MRIKLESVPPLPLVKAWFSVHSATTVSELKSVLCSDLPAFLDGQLRGGDILLLLEDFELLDSSPIDVIREGDLIIVKRNPSVTSSNKRKAPETDLESFRKRPKHANEASRQADRAPSRKLLTIENKASAKSGAKPSSSEDLEPSSSSSSESESETSSGESESESESHSGSASSSESSSSDEFSSASSAPSVRPSRHHAVAALPPKAQLTANAARSKSLPTPPHVPPGLGKPTTQSRNIRRRRKRLYERLVATAEPASVNAIPLGTRALATGEASSVPSGPSTQPAQNEAQEAPRQPILMASLQNKNKKKGFKKSMSAAVPAKIVFTDLEDETAVDEAMQEAMPFTNTADRDRGVFMANARLVPPSEKQERGLLPLNMFVTSVDVEKGLYRKKERKKRNQEQRRPAEVPDVGMNAEGNFELPYDDPEELVEPNGLEEHSARSGERPMPVRGSIEKTWASLAKITAAFQSQVGAIVGWKELGINPRTYTPEVLLNIGRVVKNDEQLVLEPVFEEKETECGLFEDQGSPANINSLPSLIELAWMTGSTPAKLVFLFNRYTALSYAFYEFVLSAQPSLSNSVCVGIVAMNCLYDELFFIIWAAFSALRVYAISGRALYLAALVFCLGMVPALTNITVQLCQNNECSSGNKRSEYLFQPKQIVHFPEFSVYQPFSSPKSRYLFSYACHNMCSSSKTIDDGIASIMLALNIADISLWNSGFIELVSGAIGPLTSLMVSHCLLNLREVIALPQDIADITSLSFAHSELQVAAHEVDSSTECTSDSTISMEMEPIESSHGAHTSDSPQVRMVELALHRKISTERHMCSGMVHEQSTVRGDGGPRRGLWDSLSQKDTRHQGASEVSLERMDWWSSRAD
ncbi:hypothetical protein IEO21_03289 [Rhodonia placenta]|uniref:Coilin n=1 Tax=Rhodonia placenta TaxID=104341 RepID=A0A8H7U4B6_9APHY|nr:hypothetical protein IEO21_03289 [Postia placenta]